MQYGGRHEIFPQDRITTYPVRQRANKVKIENLLDPAAVLANRYDVASGKKLGALAEAIIDAVREAKPVILFTGAHLVKNGLGPLVIDLVQRGIVSLLATTAAGAIHDFELALFGETSEHVPDALGKGQFGMATELGYINAALSEGNARGLGFGETLGRFVCDGKFRGLVEKRLGLSRRIRFRNPGKSIIAACYMRRVPLTVHVGIGTDVTDQHGNFDPAAKGACSGRDFLIYTRGVSQLHGGGVILNIGSAVTGPEVLLKAVSMAANIGKPPQGITAADFDLKPYRRGAMADESNFNYYFRHHKSVVTRVPEAFKGRGIYIQGNQKLTIPRLYQEIIRRRGESNLP